MLKMILEGVSHASMDYGFFGEKEPEEQVTLCWSSVNGDTRRRENAGSKKRNGISLDRKESSEVH